MADPTMTSKAALAGDEAALRNEIVLALCTDHGHASREGSLSCRTCNRRADVIIKRLYEIAAGGAAAPVTEKPAVVCLCGSTRFKDEINRVNALLTLDGKIVISLGLFGHTDMPDHDWTTNGTDLKRRLDELHKRKIDLADEVFVVNVGGYIGESTRSEIEYAETHGKPVRYLIAAAPVTEGQR